MVDKYIKELLFEHDCVIIPEFGGFITHRQQADIHPITHKFNPPSRKIAFNQQLKRSDGLLVSHLCKEEGFTSENAVAAIRDFIDTVIEELKKYNLYTLKDIGRLFYNPENNLEFEPENKINYLDKSFGLSELFFKPIERDYNVMTKVPPRVTKPILKKKPVVEKVKKVKVVQLDENGNPIKPKRTGLTLVLLIVPLLLLGLGMAYIYEHQKKNETVAEAGMVGADSTPVDTASPADSEVLASADQPLGEDGVATDPIPETEVPGLDPPSPEPVAEENVLKKKRNVIEPVQQTEAISASQGRYFVVIGSFANRDNAFKLKDKISSDGANATVIEPSGKSNLYKVSVADFDDRSAAINKMEGLRSDFGNTIWVMSY